MPSSPVPAAFSNAEKRYLEATPGSRVLYEKAKGILPNGLGRAGLQFFHYPLFIEEANAQHLYDVDGRAILDMWNGASSLPLGHRHPQVMEAVETQVAKGLGFGTMSRHEVELALELRRRIPSMERIRFTASGTEATMFAVRLAKAFTGRHKFARMAGSYHGMHDMMCSGQGMSLGGTWLGLDDNPVANGVMPEVRDTVVFLPFNDLAGCEKILDEHGSELATLIIEPFVGTGGGITAQPGFLQGLRAACNKHGILLIFDEMISIGLAPGGAQQYYGVEADLTCTGKLIGGGMPIGAFGGRADIMALLEPVNGIPPVLHTGTWNGHPIVTTAGLAQLKALDNEAYRYLSHIGDYMRSKVRHLAQALDANTLQVSGIAHFSAFQFSPKPINSPEDMQGVDATMGRRLAFSLLSQGYNLFGTRSNLSTAITETDINGFIEAFALALEEAGAIEH